MLNPWKKLSKINPQREKGNRQISSDVLEALIRSNLSGGEFKICLAIIHRTWGFNKLSDVISVKQFIQMTELSARAIKLIIKQLKEKRIIYYQPSKIRVQCGSPLNEFLFNKHYDTWFMHGCKTVHPYPRVQDSSPIDNKDNDFIDNNVRVQDFAPLDKGAKLCQTRVKNSSPTIESITKEKILNTTASPLADDINFDENLGSEPTPTQAVKTVTAQNAVDPENGIEAKGRQAEVKTFIDFAFKTYKAEFKKPLDVVQGKDGAIVKDLIGTFGLDCLKNLWLRFLVFDDWLINQSGRSIGVFKKSINKLNSAGKPRKQRKKDIGSSDFDDPRYDKYLKFVDIQVKDYLSNPDKDLLAQLGKESEEEVLSLIPDFKEAYPDWKDRIQKHVKPIFRGKLVKHLQLPNFSQWKNG